MKSILNFKLLFLTIIVIALCFRLPQLHLRPMHGDEAVHAIKFGELLEKGVYNYDPLEYHGPTLNYFTLIPAWFLSQQTLTDVSETTLRIVAVFFGVCLIVMLLFFLDGFSRPVILFAALFSAISPAMSFYSRYYIQEMLLVCFTFGAIACGFRYWKSKRLIWVIFLGVFLGLMHATKETFVLQLGAMLLAILLMLLNDHRLNLKTLKKIHPWHVLTLSLIFVFTSGLFYSSFFTNPTGILDSMLTYKSYVARGAESGIHFHPWYYYLKMLLFSKYGNGPVWSEAFVLILAIWGLVTIFVKGKKIPNNNLLRFLAFYTIILTGFYSIIPYKTPWNLLGFFHGMILLAAIGTAEILKVVTKTQKWIVYSILIVCCAHLAWQSYLANFKYYAEPTNPYVYAHPTKDILAISDRVIEIANLYPDGLETTIQVIAPNDDYWPLPWYLRSLSNVGWWNEIDEQFPSAPIILASPVVEEKLLEKLYLLPPPGQRNLYVPLFDSTMELRPQIELRGYVVNDLWMRYQQSK